MLPLAFTSGQLSETGTRLDGHLTLYSYFCILSDLGLRYLVYAQLIWRRAVCTLERETERKAMKLHATLNSVNSQYWPFCVNTTVWKRRIRPLCTQGCWDFVTTWSSPPAALTLHNSPPANLAQPSVALYSLSE